MKYIIGLDAGTSNVKAVLFDAKGKEVSVAARKSLTLNPKSNEVEQDMNQVWESARSCIREVLDQSSVDRNEIIGLGITGQGEGFWVIDHEGNPLQNAILWCDGRSVREVEELTKLHPEIGRQYYDTTGTPPLLGNQMMILKWMKDNRKDILDKAWKVLFCKDWLRYKITGIAQTEITDCLTSLLDVQTEHIAEDLMKAMDIYEYRHLLTEPVRSDEIVGTVTDVFAEEMGLPKGLPVIAGALDTSATAIGLGAIHENDVCVILGTTCASEIVKKKCDCDFGAENSRYEKHPIGDLYVALQPTLNGTPNIDWLIENIAGTRDFNVIDRMIDSAPPCCGGVVYHPYISVAGERAPFYHPYARASFFGISTETTKESLVRAVYEGITLSLRDCMADVDRSGTIYLAGGGAKSPVWAQLVADVTGMKVTIPEGDEQGAKGIALMIGVRSGLYKDYDDAVRQACTFLETYEPDPALTVQYDMLYEFYRNLRISYDDLWNQRHQMNKKIRALKEEKKA